MAGLPFAGQGKRGDVPNPGVMALGDLALVAFLTSVMCGCDTINQDVKDIAASIKPKTPREAALDMVDPHDADKRRVGTVLISNAPWGGVDVYLSHYRDMVDNERDPIVKAAAIRALARHGEPADVMRLIPHLTHENTPVRWEAAKGLQRLHNQAAVTDLLKTLNSESEHADVRIAAAIALGQYPEDRVFQGLVAALDARELAVNMAAEKSLVTLTGQSFGLDGLQWLDWYNNAAPSGTAFAGQSEYFYPTYSRDDTTWEKLTFWTSRNFEQPAPPAGLRPKSQRDTYQDQDEHATP